MLSDAETLAAAALAGDVGIAKPEGLVQALLDEIHLGTVDQLEAFFVDDHGNAAILENPVFLCDLVGIIHDISEAVAAGLFDADAQAAAGSLPTVEPMGESPFRALLQAAEAFPARAR